MEPSSSQTIATWSQTLMKWAFALRPSMPMQGISWIILQQKQARTTSIKARNNVNTRATHARTCKSFCSRRGDLSCVCVLRPLFAYWTKSIGSSRDWNRIFPDQIHLKMQRSRVIKKWFISFFPNLWNPFVSCSRPGQSRLWWASLGTGPRRSWGVGPGSWRWGSSWRKVLRAAIRAAVWDGGDGHDDGVHSRSNDLHT